jgi:hypothetical protein
MALVALAIWFYVTERGAPTATPSVLAPPTFVVLTEREEDVGVELVVTLVVEVVEGSGDDGRGKVPVIPTAPDVEPNTELELEGLVAFEKA